MKRDVLNNTTEDLFNNGIRSIGNGVFNNGYSIKNIGTKIGKNHIVEFDIGAGSVLPNIGEIVERSNPTLGFYSKFPYALHDYNYSKKSSYELNFVDHVPSEDEKIDSLYKWTTMNFMRKRMALTIDSISHNSFAKIKFGRALSHGRLYNPNIETYTFELDRQLSNYNTFAISHEKIITGFDKDGFLSVIVNMDSISRDFVGLIELSLFDSSKQNQNMTDRLKLFFEKNNGGIFYKRLNEIAYVDKILSDDFEDFCEIVQNKGIAPVQVDDNVIDSGDSFVVNKSSRNLKVTLNDESSHYVDPYGIVKTEGTEIRSLTVFKPIKVKLTGVSGTIKNGKFFEDDFDVYHKNGQFSPRDTATISSISEDGIEYMCEENPVVCISGYKTNVSASDITVEEFGDRNPIYAARLKNEADAYFEGGMLYVKSASELNFRIADDDSFTIGTVEFSRVLDNPAGDIIEHEKFIYPKNYILRDGEVLTEETGLAIPNGIFKITRQYSTCKDISGDKTKIDQTSFAENDYLPAEISIVFKDEDGKLYTDNKKDSSLEYIDYSYNFAGGYCSNERFTIESFGFQSVDNDKTVGIEHWISYLYRNSIESKTRKHYSGSRESVFPEYSVFWIGMKNVESKEQVNVFEVEYSDESHQKLGESPYQKNAGTCQYPKKEPETKLSEFNNFSTYNFYTAKGGLNIDSIKHESRFVFNTKSDPSFCYDLNMTPADFNDTWYAPSCVSFQRASSTTETIVSENSFIYDFGENSIGDDSIGKVLVVPKVGFYCDFDSDEDLFDIDESVEFFAEEFSRGVVITSQLYTLTAKIEYEENDGLVAKYILDANGESREFRYPYSEEFANPRAASLQFYSELRATTQGIECLPEVLASFLFDHGYRQCVVGVWDESNGILVNDSNLSFEVVEKKSGFDVVPMISGAYPTSRVMSSIELSVYKKGKPFVLSDSIMFSFRKIGIIDLSNLYDVISNENTNNSDSYVAKKLRDSIKSLPMISFIPSVFESQQPWSGVRESTSSIFKILCCDEYEMLSPGNSMMEMRASVSLDNYLNIIGDVDAVTYIQPYKIIYGYVEKQTVSKRKSTPLQRGDNTYHILYDSIETDSLKLSRDIVIDLDVYPHDKTYMLNNVISELIVPVRENGHDMTMDARSVFVRFDTRYISDSIKSYYEKFNELPTSFECNMNPEESVLNIQNEPKERMFKNYFDTILGTEVVTEVETKFSIVNNTNLDKMFKFSFKNNKMKSVYMNVVSEYNMDDFILYLKSGDLFNGFHDEIIHERSKKGFRLKKSFGGV